MPKRERSSDSDDYHRHKKSRHTSHHSHRHKETVSNPSESVNKVLESKSGKKTYLPAPLRLDDDGNEIDAEGNIMKNRGFKPIATLKINQKTNFQVVNPYLQDKEIVAPVVDHRIHQKIRVSRKERGLKFREEGSYVKKAEAIRSKQERILINEIQKKQFENSTDVQVDIISTHEQEVPNMEWWDGVFLEVGKQDDFLHANTYDKDSYHYSDLNPDNCETIGLVHHPKYVEPIVAQSKPKSLPLLYTKKEQKKLRRRERMDKQRKTQDMITLGLQEAPEPKLTRSNMMQLYKDEAVINPTIIEQKMQEQVNQRLENHQKRNEDRKLTPAQRKVKKLKKLIGERTGQLYMSVFKVENLSNVQHRFKVDVNAQQNYLNGQVVLCPNIQCNMVLVEGTLKSIRRYSKLMLKRIDWTKLPSGETIENKCNLVWQGLGGKIPLKDFVIDEVPNYIVGREKLELRNLAQYWDMVKNYKDTEIT